MENKATPIKKREKKREKKKKKEKKRKKKKKKEKKNKSQPIRKKILLTKQTKQPKIK